MRKESKTSSGPKAGYMCISCIHQFWGPPYLNACFHSSLHFSLWKNPHPVRLGFDLDITPADVSFFCTFLCGFIFPYVLINEGQPAHTPTTIDIWHVITDESYSASMFDILFGLIWHL